MGWTGLCEMRKLLLSRHSGYVIFSWGNHVNVKGKCHLL